MDRDIDSATLAEINADQCIPVNLLEIEWDNTYTRICDFNRDITHDGNTYVAMGHYLGFSEIEETSQLTTGTLTGSLSGVDNTFIALFLSENYLDRPINLYKGFLDSALTLIADPILMFSGRMHKPLIQENPDDGTCTLSIEAASHWVDFERRSGRHTNHAEQQVWFAGDLGFSFASEVMKDVPWGRKS
jgi:hypothetical protein